MDLSIKSVLASDPTCEKERRTDSSANFFQSQLSSLSLPSIREREREREIEFLQATFSSLRLLHKFLASNEIYSHCSTRTQMVAKEKERKSETTGSFAGC